MADIAEINKIAKKSYFEELLGLTWVSSFYWATICISGIWVYSLILEKIEKMPVTWILDVLKNFHLDFPWLIQFNEALHAPASQSYIPLLQATLAICAILGNGRSFQGLFILTILNASLLLEITQSINSLCKPLAGIILMYAISLIAAKNQRRKLEEDKDPAVYYTPSISLRNLFNTLAFIFLPFSFPFILFFTLLRKFGFENNENENISNLISRGTQIIRTAQTENEIELGKTMIISAAILSSNSSETDRNHRAYQLKYHSESPLGARIIDR